MSRWRDPAALGEVVGLVFAAIVLAWPLSYVLGRSVWDDGPTLTYLGRLLSEPLYRDALVHSLVVAGGGALGATLLGVPLAVCLARFRFRGQRAITALSLLALLSPPFIGAYAWILLLGTQGTLRGWLQGLGWDPPAIYGPQGIVLVFALQYYPVVVLLTKDALSTVDASLEEAAASLGAGRWTRLRRVVLPLALPGIGNGLLIAFMLSLANFGTPAVLGRNYETLPTLAYGLFRSEVAQEPGLPAAACVLLILCAGGGLVFTRWWLGRRQTAGDLLRVREPQPLVGWQRWAVPGLCWTVVAASSLPLIAVVATSFRATRGLVFRPGLSLDSYRAVLEHVPLAGRNSLLFATLAVLGIGVGGAWFGYTLARRKTAAARVLEVLLMTPYLVPGIALGLGYVMAFHQGPLPLTGTAAILVLAYTVRRLPYAVRSCEALLAQLDPSLEEAARSLGASPTRAFGEVTLPLMAPGIASGMLLGWTTAVNELSASVVLYVGDTITLPVLIYQRVNEGAYGPAAALATVLLAVTGAVLYALLRWADATGSWAR
ncbi:MAG: iron ABC transporter permease [Planctomycetota bacterium]